MRKKRLETMQTGVGDSFTEEPPAKKPFSTNQTQESIKENSLKDNQSTTIQKK